MASTITNSKHDRFKDAPWYPKQDIFILIGGAGGIGSWTTMLITRAGFKVFIYDDDVIEEHNIGGQLYPIKYVKQEKVAALQTIIKEYSDSTILTYTEKYDEDSASNKFCIAAFDNMKARKIMYENWLASYGHNSEAIFIDGRLNAEQMWIYCVRGGRTELRRTIQKQYSDLLFDDSEVAEEPCTMKQTSHSAAMIASHITAFFCNHMTNVYEGAELRSVPFEWFYMSPMDLLEVKP